ncbi:hypothetical protein TRIP_C20344 [Candidatus Zixiibacteriota bacterium]|nr:hypothetical protein TRIP_C20344 [candidate division Zixibacteria bacterium]
MSDNDREQTRDQIRKAKEFVTHSKERIGEQIEKYRGLYDQLEYSEYYLSEQEKILSQEVSVPPIYTSTASGMAHSGSMISSEIDGMLNSQELVFRGIEDHTKLLTSSVTGTYSMLAMQTTGTIHFGGPLPSLEIDWDSLDRSVSEIDPDLGKIVRGARAALDDPSPDSVRHACHSLRDCLTHVMDRLAPIEDVKQANWYIEDKTSKTGVTRKQRLIYIALGSHAKDTNPDDLSESELELVANTIEVNNEIIKNSHKLKEAPAEKIKPSVRGYCSNIVTLLDLHKSNSHIS